MRSKGRYSIIPCHTFVDAFPTHTPGGKLRCPSSTWPFDGFLENRCVKKSRSIIYCTIYRIVSVSFRYCLLVILFGVIFIWKFLKSNFATICESSHLIVTVCKPACLAWHTGTRVDELNGESVLSSENYFDRKNDPICSLSYSFGFTKPLRTRRVYS